jgi:hypothetical protein
MDISVKNAGAKLQSPGVEVVCKKATLVIEL